MRKALVFTSGVAVSVAAAIALPVSTIIGTGVAIN